MAVGKMSDPGKQVGERVPFEPGEYVWSRLNGGGPWIVLSSHEAEHGESATRVESSDRIWNASTAVLTNKRPPGKPWRLAVALLCTGWLAHVIFAWLPL